MKTRNTVSLLSASSSRLCIPLPATATATLEHPDGPATRVNAQTGVGPAPYTQARTQTRPANPITMTGTGPAHIRGPRLVRVEAAVTQADVRAMLNGVLEKHPRAFGQFAKASLR